MVEHRYGCVNFKNTDFSRDAENRLFNTVVEKLMQLNQLCPKMKETQANLLL